MYLLTDRRNQRDRRQRDIGPPDGCAERRQQGDRRLRSEAYTLSEAEYQRYFGCPPDGPDEPTAGAECVAPVPGPNVSLR